MRTSASQSALKQLHEFEFPLVNGKVDLDQVTAQDLTQLVTIFLALLAERKAED